MVDLVRETTFFVEFLSAADKADWDLLVGADNTGEGVGGQDAIRELFADIGRRRESVLLILVVLVEVAEPLEEVEFERYWLGAIVDKKGGVFAPLTHVEGAEVE